MGSEIGLEGKGTVRGDTEIIDQGGRRGETSREAVLNRFISDGDTQMGFTPTRTIPLGIRSSVQTKGLRSPTPVILSMVSPCP